MVESQLADLKRRMDGALEALRREFAGLRTGRASAHLLEPVSVQAYGNEMPITQVGTIKGKFAMPAWASIRRATDSWCGCRSLSSARSGASR